MTLNLRNPSAGKKPFLPITEIEHAAFCKSEDELPAKPLLDEIKVNIRWQKIPLKYLRLTAEELDQRIHQARQELGTKVVVLGHHYQREEVIEYADFQGDSYLLSKQAASQTEAEYIIFCGVHFMAETARILCAPHQRVILPNITAGCSMADMAPTDDVLDAWDDLEGLLGPNSVIPITYMNSTAEIKALCGTERGHRLHLLQRRSDLQMGLPARRPGTLSPRSAPGTQHRLQDGHRLGQDDCLEPLQAHGRTHCGAYPGIEGHPLAGALFSAYPLLPPADRDRPPEVPGHHRDRTPGVHPRNATGRGY